VGLAFFRTAIGWMFLDAGVSQVTDPHHGAA
jgi:hypothetical protein